MRCGVTMFVQGYEDWDRYLERDRGEDAADIDPTIDRRRVSEELETGVMVEEMGFDSVWTVEHHITPYAMVPNPLQLLSFIAGATKRIDVGTMVVVVPWHHPLRVAEEITMLQYALQGRTPFIGLGRGAGRREFEQLGFDMNESRDRFREATEIVKLALTQEQFSYEGEHYKYENVTMRPRPLDPDVLMENLHFAWGSPTSAAGGASLGLKPLVIPQRPWEEYHGDLEVFGKARSEAGYEPARPRICVNVWVGENETEAHDGAHRYIPEYTFSAEQNYEIGGSHFSAIKGYEYWAQMAEGANADGLAQTYLANQVWGTPDQCVEKLRGIADAFHPEEFMLAFRYGSMTRAVAEKNMELFVKEVLPAVREFKLESPLVSA